MKDEYEKSQIVKFHKAFFFTYFFAQQSNYSFLTVCFKLNDRMIILQTDKNLLNMTKYLHIMANHVNSLDTV